MIERHLSFDDPHYYMILGASLIWLLAVEARWFAVELGSSAWKGLGEAAKMIGVWALLFLPIVYLLS